ncbi:unnamed protein product [Prorocentrum cordatum]|uniref:C2 NT-type domain-containing protein n=1 Tax=Prorocentrum cordatum TaxID=2364126 RepID=A0ABN9W2H7_9DINO|nr:unnamed protein product [Polarella glacialis]
MSGGGGGAADKALAYVVLGEPAIGPGQQAVIPQLVTARDAIEPQCAPARLPDTEAPSNQAAAPPRSIWTQLDKMRLPRQRTGELGRYLVSVGWDGVRGSERTTEVKDGIERDGMEECVWRQQVQLTGQPGAQTVLLRVLRVGRSGSDQALVGELRLDAVSDAGTKPDPWYDLAGKDGLKSDAKVKLRLVEPKPDAAAPSARIAPSAVVQDPHAAADARRPPDKAAGAPAAKSPPMQRGRATSHLSHFQRGGAPLPTDEEGSDGEEEEEESELADEEEEEEEEQSESEQEQSAASAGTAGKSVGTGGRAAGRARTPQQRAGTPQRARA